MYQIKLTILGMLVMPFVPLAAAAAMALAFRKFFHLASEKHYKSAISAAAGNF